MVSGSASVRHRTPWRLRDGRGKIRRLDVRAGACTRNHTLPAHAVLERGQTVGLLWIDAHSDMNTPETSPTGNIHGMPLACCLGNGPQELTSIFGYSPKVEPRNVVLIGLRDVDMSERRSIRDS